jgi:hypothetical protein
LLPLAKGEKLAQFIEVCLREGLTEYLQLILDVGLLTDPAVIWQKILEVKQMRPVLTEDTWKAIDEFFRQTPEAPEKLTSWQEVIAESARRERQRERQQTLKQTLLRLLHHKFSEVPGKVAQQIEATEDPERLNEWIDRILDAKTLADMELETEKEQQ